MVLPSTSGRPVLQKQKKGFISHRTQKDSHVQNGPPTHHGRRSAPSTHPRPNLYYIQQTSSAAVRTPEQPCSSTYSTAEQQCSSTYITTAVQQYVQQYSNAAVPRAVHLTGEQQPICWLQCSRAGRDSPLLGQAKSACVADSAHGKRRRLDAAVFGPGVVCLLLTQARLWSRVHGCVHGSSGQKAIRKFNYSWSSKTKK